MSPLLRFTPDELQAFMVTRIPFNEFNGLKVVRVAEHELVVDLPFDPRLVGDAEANALHEGPITTLLDTVCGSVPLTVMDVLRRTATLDLRVDFLRNAGPGLGVRCETRIVSLDDHIATVRGIAHDGDPARPVAVATATFAVFSPPPGEAP
ncbi:PaaI family thioesterase [Nevskia sp.]|uniref:PaaI family thioesterase n=1 Tax=Nevskia sp. TaxID=1929292 RepID=UPI0025D05354|nr:PaaI family thioesterase [Nevskia sp.]